MSEDQVRQEAFEQLIRHAYRMRSTMLVHTKALYRDLVQRDKSVTIPAGAEWNVPEAANPWKSSQPFSAAELTAFVEDGMRRYQLTDLQFEPVAFSQDLVPASPLQLADRDLGQLGPGRHDQAFYSYVRKAPTTLELQITGGLISHYRDRGNVRVQVWKLGGTSRSGRRETLVATDRSVPPDGVRRTVRIRVDEEGLYKLLISDGGDRTEVSWPDGQPMTIASSVQSPMNSHHTSWMMVFYVPQGTRVVGLHGGGHGEVRDGEDRPVFWLNGREPNFYAVPVPEGQDGRLWQIRYGRGPIRLLTVPPYFARRADELLLPREVVESAGR
jgi:hypothetical protein